MTDKQIIIDGVDVSGCGFYESNGMCSCSLVYYDYCKDFPNCVYKLSQQLRAKEQECEELKNFHINLVGVKECEIRELVKLKAENDLLRKTHKTEQDRRRAYEQALTEIKEIAEAHKKYIYVLPSYSVAGDSLEFSFEFTKEILQKISEVLDE